MPTLRGRPLPWRTGAALAALAMLVTACGGTAAVTTGSSTIAFGVDHPFTGAYAFVGEACLQGAQVATQEINAAGGVLGHKLVMDHADTLGDPADAVPATNQLVAVDNVKVVIGTGGLEVTAVQPLLDKDKIPFMFEGGDTLLDHTHDPFLWRDSPSDAQEGIAMALYALQKGYKSAVMMMTSITSAQDFVPVIESAFKKGGGKILGNETLTPSQSSYESQIQQVIKLHPQVIFTQMDPVTGGTVFTEFQQLNSLGIPFIGTDTTAGSDFVSAVTAQEANKALTSAEGASASTQATPVWLKWFHKSKQGQPLASAVYAYDATIVAALAMDKAGTTNGPKVAKQIPQVADPPGIPVYSYAQGLKDIKAGKKINYEGASGSFDYNQYHNVFGPFAIVKSNLAGSFKQIAVISGAAIEKAAA